MARKNNGGTKKSAVVTAAALAALAGVYFFYGKESARRRKKIKSWMLRAKADVIDMMEDTKELTREKYHEIIDTVSSNYRGLTNVDKKELEDMVADLKSHWSNITEQVQEGKKKKKKK